MPDNLFTAERFIERLSKHQSDDELRKIQRYFKSGDGDYGQGDQFMGVRMGQVFDLAKDFISMSPLEIEKLLENPIHEVRAGAMSIMDKQGRHKKTSDDRRQELYDLYIRRHDRINNWDLVDLAATHVVGRYLSDKPRHILCTHARSDNLWERRTAIVATSYFQKLKQLDDTFALAEILLNDKEDLIHKAVGGWIRNAGTVHQGRLLAFLDQHASKMPRTMLRYVIEHLDEEVCEAYMGRKS